MNKKKVVVCEWDDKQKDFVVKGIKKAPTDQTSKDLNEK